MAYTRCEANSLSTAVSSLRRMCLNAALCAAVVGFVCHGSSMSAQVGANAGLAGSGVDPMVQRNITDWAVQGKGVTEDWSDHHLAFPNPATEQEAIKNGTYEQWLKIVNEPRFIKQQIRRSGGAKMLEGAVAPSAITAGAAGASNVLTTKGAEMFGSQKGTKKVALDKDWSMGLGAGTGVLHPNTFPAKYSFSTTTESCSDYVVYPTGLLGSAAQATVIAYDSLYGGTAATCGTSATRPSVDWAYNTGGISSLSPVISDDGTQVSYIQTASSVASLVLVKVANSGGTAILPAAITSVTNANYRGCTAPCYTTIALSGNPNDTNSSPFYIYGGGLDTMYVGANDGKVHKFTGVFYGTPAESAANGWPVTTTASDVLTSAIWEPNSTLLFVGGSGGYLYSITTTGGASQTVLKSARLGFGTVGITDAPLIDEAPASPTVYAFVGDDGTTNCGTSSKEPCSDADEFPTGFANGASATHTYLVSSSSGSTTSTTIYSGAFDNIHYDGAGTTGNLYVCGVHNSGADSRLYQIAVSTGTVTAESGANDVSVGASVCSPVTEFLGSKTSTTITAAIASTATSVTIVADANIVAGDYIQIDSEIILVSSVSGTGTTTVNFTPANTHRGQLGTTAATHSNGAAVTDIQDWIYLSVSANGSDTTCSGACLYNYSVTSGTVPASATTGIAAAGGTSGVIIDNSAPSSTSAATGEAQIYYSTLATQTCTGNGTTGAGTQVCAVQTSQSAP